MDVLVGIIHPAQLMRLTDAVRQAVRQNIGAAVQTLPDGPGQQQLADPGSKGIDGHDAAGVLPPSLRLHDGGRHAFPQEAPLRFAVKSVGLAHPQLVFQPRLVEKGHIQRAGVVHGPHLHQIHAFADVGQRRLRGDHGGDAGRFAGDELADGLYFPAVLIASGEPVDEVAQRGDAQLAQRFCLGLANALDVPHIGVQIRHAPASFPQFS